MPECRQIVDRRGRVWTAVKVEWGEAEEEDFRFWYERLTPEQRVEAVADALEGCLKTRGRGDSPRLRRVHRRIECRWGAVSGDTAGEISTASGSERRLTSRTAPGAPLATARGTDSVCQLNSPAVSLVIDIVVRRPLSVGR
jgi:hypothetical protein